MMSKNSWRFGVGNMHNIKLPIFYQPNEVVFLDDNQNFLNSLTIVLPNEFHYKNFTSPETCLAYLKDFFSKKANEPRRNIFVVKDEDEPGMELNLPAIHQQIYNKNRFKEIAVCVTDYTMPVMDGIEFCEAIRDFNCQKILLTGDAGHDLAVRAFNNGVIQKFILKDSPEYTKTVIDAIAEQRLNYFIKQSQTLLGSSFETNPNQLQFLFNAEIKHYFDQACNTKGIIEYYLLDEHGSYLMLDMHGRATWLYIKDEKELDRTVEFLEYDNAPKDVIDKIKKHTHIPFFFSIDDFETPFENWSAYLQPVIKSVRTENTTYYISIMAGDDTPYKLEKPILTYAQFMEEL